MKMISQINRQTFHGRLEKSPLAVLLIDQNYNHVYTNASFLKFSRLSSSEIIRQGWSSCMRKSEQQALLQSISDMRLTGRTYHKRILRISKNDNRFTPVEITCERNVQLGTFYMLKFFVSDKKSGVARPASKQKLKGFSFVPLASQNRKVRLEGTNVKINSPFMKSQMRREEYISELKASNHLKDKILAIISHDMSAPIASLKGLTSAFFDEELTGNERALVRDSLLKQLDAVSDLTDNLLRWATRSFEKRNLYEPEDLNLAELIERNIALIQPQSVAKRIEIKNDTASGLNVFANNDQVHIVIRNVLTNAMKYTPDGGCIHISGKAENAVVQICISDTGIGMSSDQISKLFTYSQGNTYGTNGEKGIGIGLLLCKEYVEGNGGKIQVTSDSGKGTRVIIDLPASRVG
jgi:signal transduction histidine kinase